MYFLFTRYRLIQVRFAFLPTLWTLASSVTALVANLYLLLPVVVVLTFLAPNNSLAQAPDNAFCVSVLNRVSARSSSIGPDFFLKGRINKNRLKFTYSFSKTKYRPNGIDIDVFYEGEVAGHIDLGSADPLITHVGIADLTGPIYDVYPLRYTGLGSLLYTVAAKLAYDRHGQILGGTRYGQQSGDAQDLWGRLGKKGLAVKNRQLFKKIFLVQMRWIRS